MTRVPGLVWVCLLGAALAAGCTVQRRTLSEQCDLSTQCEAPLVCRLARCRRECGNVRDCPVGSICVPTDEGSGVCLLPEETRCALRSDCPEPLVCLDGHCGNECVEDRDCASGAVCRQLEGGGVCVDPTEERCSLPSDCGAGLTCVDGRCLAECRADRDCREGERCAEGRCERIPFPDAGVDTGIDAGVDARVLVEVCATPEDCWAPNAATYGCVDDRCTIETCLDDWGDCDATYENGCEADLRVTEAHCGGCGRACGSGGVCADSTCDGVVDVMISESNVCAIRGNRRLICTGDNSSGQLGLGMPTSGRAAVPAVAIGVIDAVEMAVGFDTICVRDSTGAVSCAGDGTSGEVGDGHWSRRYLHTPVVGLTDATAIEAHLDHFCAIRESGEVVCWGRGVDGQLGDGSTASSNVPVTVSGITDAVDVAAGRAVSCAVHATGAVSCWGSNANGVLGDGLLDHGTTCPGPPAGDCSPTPVSVAGITDAEQIDIGYDHACVVHASGAVSCWGAGGFDLGPLADESPERTPIAIPGITDAVQVDAFPDVTCVLRTSGAVACFGYNGAGELGRGSYDESAEPVDVVGLDDATDIAADFGRVCAISASRGMVCWGDNYNGDLGPEGIGEIWLEPHVVAGFNL